MTKQPIEERIQESLEEIREKCAGMLDALDIDDFDDVGVGQVAELLAALKDKAEACDQAAATAEVALEETTFFSMDDVEHVLRALKHLGVTDLQRFTNVEIRMAMEQTVGL